MTKLYFSFEKPGLIQGRAFLFSGWPYGEAPVCKPEVIGSNPIPDFNRQVVQREGARVFTLEMQVRNLS